MFSNRLIKPPTNFLWCLYKATRLSHLLKPYQAFMFSNRDTTLMSNLRQEPSSASMSSRCSFAMASCSDAFWASISALYLAIWARTCAKASSGGSCVNR